MINVSIVTAEKLLYEGQASRVVCPGIVGDLEILPNHAPLLAMLSSGQLLVSLGQEEEYFYVSGGIVEVQKDGLIVLADSGERAQDLDEAKAKEAQQRAQALLISKNAAVNLSEVYRELAEALQQIKLIQKLRNKRG